VDASLVLSIIAVGASVVALGVSTAFGVLQLRILRQQNHVPAIVELLTEYRKAEFHDRYRYVVSSLAEEHDPSFGLSELPEPARTIVYDVAYYHQTWATLFGTGIMDRRSAPILHERIVYIWTALKPYVAVERTRYPNGPTILLVLERYATKTLRDTPIRRQEDEGTQGRDGSGTDGADS
jgi:hypothetical protein